MCAGTPMVFTRHVTYQQIDLAPDANKRNA